MGKFVMVVLLFAVIVYGVLRLLDSRRGSGVPGPAQRSRPTRPQPRVVAPDDDEDFLRGLDRRRRHRGDPDKGPDSPG